MCMSAYVSATLNWCPGVKSARLLSSRLLQENSHVTQPNAKHWPDLTSISDLTSFSLHPLPATPATSDASTCARYLCIFIHHMLTRWMTHISRKWEMVCIFIHHMLTRWMTHISRKWEMVSLARGIAAGKVSQLRVPFRQNEMTSSIADDNPDCWTDVSRDTDTHTHKHLFNDQLQVIRYDRLTCAQQLTASLI